jgi:uracil-DNA glycosylase family 4
MTGGAVAGHARPTLPSVHHAIVTCERCPRLRAYCARIAREKKRAHRDDTYWGRPVPGFGDPGARLLVLGLAPAAHGANRTGRVFTGDAPGGSGDFLMEAMHALGFANQPFTRSLDDGLALHDAFIAAAVRCAPPDNRPTPDEIANCTVHLDAELACLRRLSVVVALGRIATDAYLAWLGRQGLTVRPRPAFAHGAVWAPPSRSTRSGTGGRRLAAPALVMAYHPSRQNTNTGRLTQAMLRDAFTTARRMLEGADPTRGTAPAR